MMTRSTSGLHALIFLMMSFWVSEGMSEVRDTPLTAPASWQSVHFQDHPLVGTVWRGTGEPAGWQALDEAVSQANFVLLGEIHPNPDHHRFQARVLSALTVMGRQPRIVWEMIPAARQPVLDNWLSSESPNADKLGQALDWQSSGWPEWAIYQSIAQVAARERIRMIGAALPRETLMGIGRRGIEGLNAPMRARLHLNIEMPAQAQTALIQSLRDGHCGLMPESALAAMSVAQRARDGAMAAALSGTQSDADAVLIAGNGHVSQDGGGGGSRARPKTEAQSTDIAQIEVQDQPSAPEK